MRTLEQIESAIRDSSIPTTADLDKAILDAAGLELEAAVSTSHVRHRFVLRGRPIRFAAVAVVLAGLVVGAELLHVFDVGGVAWAEVADRMAQADRFMFRLRVNIAGEAGREQVGDSISHDETDVAMSYFVSPSLGVRWDLFADGRLTASFFYAPNADSGMAINYEERTWSRIPVSANAPQGYTASPVRDPESYVRSFLERDYVELGTSTIDSLEVEGVEVVNPPTRYGSREQIGPDMNGVGRLWVSVDSGLPVRIELEQQAEQQRLTWTLDFRWGAQVDVAVFEARVPAGFTEGR